MTPELPPRPAGKHSAFLCTNPCADQHLRPSRLRRDHCKVNHDARSGAAGTRPNYIDTTSMPATSAKWKYRAIYCKDSQRLGQWNSVAVIAVIAAGG